MENLVVANWYIYSHLENSVMDNWNDWLIITLWKLAHAWKNPFRLPDEFIHTNGSQTNRKELSVLSRTFRYRLKEMFLKIFRTVRVCRRLIRGTQRKLVFAMSETIRKCDGLGLSPPPPLYLCYCSDTCLPIYPLLIKNGERGRHV